MRTFYHATSFDNLGSVISTGLELRNIEKLIYLCECPKDCLKFALLHGCKSVLVCKVKVKDEDVIETFDHSAQFFQCRCFASMKPIPLMNIVEFRRYEL